jgi:hypothetical protein
MKPSTLPSQSVTQLKRNRTLHWLSQPQGFGGLLTLALALVAISLASCQVGDFSVTLESETEPTQAAGSEPSPQAEFTPQANGTLVVSAPAGEALSTERAGCTNQAEFVADLSVPDGSQIAAGEIFLKSWRLRNMGTCTWDAGYTMFFAGGHRLEAVDAQPLPGVVAPGQEVDLTVAMTAPQLDGNYRGEWLLMDTSGQAFGIGPDGLSPFWVSIVVGAGSDPSKATPVADTPAAGICGQAEGEVVTMRINPDVPDPRCLKVGPDQRLRVVNNLGEAITVSLFTQSAVIQPGGEHTFAATFGELLLPGVHLLDVSTCCGGSIWLQGP